MLIHFVGLVVQTWYAFIASLGNTTLGFFLPTIVVPFTGFLLYIGIVLWREGWAAVKDHLLKTLGLAATVAIAGEILIYGTVLGWTTVKTVYHDHMFVTGVAARFRHELVAKELADDARFAPIHTAMQSKIDGLSIQCAKTEGKANTLDKQNRDQQNTINNCQTEAMKLLAPVAQKITILSWSNSVENGVDHSQTFLLLTNKEVTVTHIEGTCDAVMKTANASILGSGFISGGTEVSKPNRFTISISSPAWTPESPIRLDVTYIKSVTAKCFFSVR